MLDNHRFIPGRYNPLEEEANINNLDKIHKNKKLYNQSNYLNAIIAPHQECFGKRCIDTNIDKLKSETNKHPPVKRDTPWVIYLIHFPKKYHGKRK